MSKFWEFILVIAFSCYQCYSSNENSANDKEWKVQGTNGKLLKEETIAEKCAKYAEKKQFTDEESKEIFDTLILPGIENNKNGLKIHLIKQGHCGFIKPTKSPKTIYNMESRFNEITNSKEIVISSRVASPYPRSYFSEENIQTKQLYEDYAKALTNQSSSSQQYTKLKKIAKEIINKIFSDNFQNFQATIEELTSSTITIKISSNEITGYTTDDDITYKKTNLTKIIFAQEGNELIIRSIYPVPR